MEKSHDLHPDLIFFTGDVAYGQLDDKHGYQIADQFADAELIFDGIRKTFTKEVAQQDFFIVPGNHDVNRTQVTPDQAEWLDKQDDVQAINSVLQNNTRHWKNIADRLADYRYFLEKSGYHHLLQDPDYLIYGVTRDVSNVKVGIAGLNTAWSGGSNEQKGRLWTASRWQIDRLTNKLIDSDFKLALHHHPTNWFVPQEDNDVRRLIESDFNFSLHGHEHDEWVDQVNGHVRIAAAACFEGSGGRNGYNFVRINLSTGEGSIWLRRYDMRGGGGWVQEAIPGKTLLDGVWLLKNLPQLDQRVNKNQEVERNSRVVEPFTNKGISIVFGDGRGKRTPLAYSSDLPPVVDAWVQRNDEFSELDSIVNGVVAVSGIGGQGKSALVAKYLDAWKETNPTAFWDWRDCREEGERFHTQIVEIIERMTKGAISGASLVDADTKSLVRFLFQVAGNTRCLIILDNVDHYVNTTTSEFTLGVSLLVQEALRVNHNILFILTCRPQVNYANARFHEIRLKGLTEDQAIKLFGMRGIKLDDNALQIICEMHSLTRGHTLWMNLIAVQILRDPKSAPIILGDLRNRHIDDQSRAMFRTLWSGLSSKQKLLLRSMAEVLYPETFATLEVLARPILTNFNQFNKTFKTLRAMSLIVERGTNFQGRKFDLHPLMRSYIRTEYPSLNDRQRFIDPILSFFDKLFNGDSNPDSGYSLDNIERWTAKAELEVTCRRTLQAIDSLEKAADQLIATGRYEEFLRIAKLILDDEEWSNIEFQDHVEFHTVVVRIVMSLVDHKREREARIYASRYGRTTSHGTVAYLRMCKMYCHMEWLLQNYDDSIEWGRSAMSLKDQSQMDTNVEISNDLALALRDSGQIDEALKIFAPDRTITDVLSDDCNTTGRQPNYYGNIGRCLQYKGELEGALTCYTKAAKLMNGKIDSTTVDNRGYAYLWIGEVLKLMKSYEYSYKFFRGAADIWKVRAPLRLNLAADNLYDLHDYVAADVRSLNEDENALQCIRWINEH